MSNTNNNSNQNLGGVKDLIDIVSQPPVQAPQNTQPANGIPTQTTGSDGITVRFKK